MDVETFRDDRAVHLEVSPKATFQEARFERLTVEEERVLEKKREHSIRSYDDDDDGHTFC